MKGKTFFFILFSVIFLSIEAAEINSVTLSSEMKLNEAITAIEVLSLHDQGIKIYNMSGKNDEIGLPIVDLPWRKAIKLIAIYNHLILEEKSGIIMIKEPENKKDKESKQIDSRLIKITTTAFIVNKSFINSFGIDWATIMNGKVKANVAFNGATSVPSDIFKIEGGTTILNGITNIDISALLKIIETKQVGKIIANPKILVTPGEKGYIQVGQDFSVKSKDKSGNTIDKFFSTGIILDVQPKIIQEKGENEIGLKVKIERSSVVPGDISTVINKSQSQTDLVLYDGEETVIAGLYSSDVLKIRSGIPILKDLPWWFLGIRYLTGFNKKSITERELVIILKAEIIDSAHNRKIKNTIIFDKDQHKEKIPDFPEKNEKN